MKRSTIGLLLIGAAVLMVPAVLVAFAISNFVISAEVTHDPSGVPLQDVAIEQCMGADGAVDGPCVDAAMEGLLAEMSPSPLVATIGNAINVVLSMVIVFVCPILVLLGVYFLVSEPQKKA